MLTDAVALTWEDAEPLLGRSSFPPQLRECAELHDPGMGPFLMRCALIYRAPGIVLLDTSVHWDAESGAVRLTARERDTLAERLALARTAPRSALRAQRCGIAEVLARPPYGGAVAELIGPAPQEVAAARAWLFEPQDGPHASDPLPDAMAFHSIALPDTLTLKIEPTTRCNFSCGFCYGRHLEQGDLDRARFDAVLDRMPGLRGVELTGEGEPLLNKNIYSFIAASSRRGLFTHITTNGSALTERNIDKLLDAGLKSLAVSIESLHPEKFARYRPGGDVALVTAGIRRVVERKRARDVELSVSLWTTLMRDNVHEVPALRRFAREAGVDHFECFQTLNPMPSYRRFYDAYLKTNMLSEAEIAGLVAAPDTDPDVRDALQSATAVYRQTRCDIFMTTAMVNWQGEMTPCCLLKYPDTPSLGNLVQDSLETIWQRPDFERFRFALQHGIVLEPCRGCPDVAGARRDWIQDSC